MRRKCEEVGRENVFIATKLAPGLHNPKAVSEADVRREERRG